MGNAWVQQFLTVSSCIIANSIGSWIEMRKRQINSISGHFIQKHEVVFYTPKLKTIGSEKFQMPVILQFWQTAIAQYSSGEDFLYILNTFYIFHEIWTPYLRRIVKNGQYVYLESTNQRKRITTLERVEKHVCNSRRL